MNPFSRWREKVLEEWMRVDKLIKIFYLSPLIRHSCHLLSSRREGIRLSSTLRGEERFSLSKIVKYHYLFNEVSIISYVSFK
jgi:hypothetical protein